MTHDIKAVGLTAGVVIGWHLCELTNLEAKLCEDVRHFKKAKPYWRPAILPRPPRGVMRSPAFALRTLIGVAVDVLFLSRRRKYIKQRRSWPGAGVEVTAPRGRHLREEA